MPTQIRQNPTVPALSPVQVKVIAALAAGQTVSAAAVTAGVHRSTVHAWLKEPGFLAEYDKIRHDCEAALHDEVLELQRLALQVIRGLLTNPETPPSVRLRAAIQVLNRPLPPLALDPPVPDEVNGPEPPLTARNAPCPCGSGQKFKRCCGANSPPMLNAA